MSDEPTNNPTEENEDTTPVGDPVAVMIAESTKTLVDTAQTDGSIRQKVVEHFAEVEKARRVDMLVKAMDARTEKAKELSRIKPDNICYDEDGQQTSASWSKEQAAKRKTLRKELNRLDKAINKAINDADYSALQKFA